ncbi:MAG: hypothetical protein ACLTG4_12000 [Oscillospiraceae bacterium]
MQYLCAPMEGATGGWPAQRQHLRGDSYYTGPPTANRTFSARMREIEPAHNAGIHAAAAHGHCAEDFL